MSRISSAVAVILVHALAALAAAQEQPEWKTFTSPDKAFSALLPGVPKSKEQTVAGTDQTMTIHVVDLQSKAYLASVVTVPPGEFADVSLEQRFAGAREGMLKNTPNGKLLSETKMSGVVWALDHPYSAVTDLDGNFKIDNVPTGVNLTVTAWHEAVGFFHSEVVSLKPRETKQMDFGLSQARVKLALGEDGKITAVYKNGTDGDLKVNKQVLDSAILALEVRDPAGNVVPTLPPPVPLAKPEFTVIGAGREISMGYRLDIFAAPLAPGQYTVRTRLGDEWQSNDLTYVVRKKDG